MTMTLLLILLGYVFICGAPLFTIMLAATALGSFFSVRGFEPAFDGAINKLFGTSGRDEMEVLSTIPLFIYAGYILAEAKTADRLVRFANAVLGWLPGGLAIVTIMTCALFTVFTGASGVTIIALGGVLMPALLRNGYPERFSLGLIAGTGSVGLLLPPALPLFIFGTIYGLNQSEAEKKAGVWATERFIMAGIIPGMFLIGMMCMVAMFVAVRKKLPTQKFSGKELGTSFLAAIPELFIPFGVIIGLAVGFGLPEIASLTVVYVLVLEIGFFRTIKLKMLWNISFEAMAMIGAIFMIILASTALTDFMVNAQVPQAMVRWTTDNIESKIVFLLAINVILLIVGTVMDIFSAIVVVVPLIAPIAREYGIDPYHLGVIFLLNLEVGYLHPPVGLNLFLTSVKFQRPITEVMWATIPFLITMIVALMIITYVPQLTAWSVPPAKRTDPVRNLTEIVERGRRESKISAPKLALQGLRADERGAVFNSGTPLKNAEGKPIERMFIDCRPKPDKLPIGLDKKPVAPPSTQQSEACEKVFLDYTECVPDAKRATPEQLACGNLAVAMWTAARFIELPEGEKWEAPTTLPEIAVKSVTLVDSTGQPLKALDEPVVDKDDKPFTRTLEFCDTLEFKSDREKCRGLFVVATSCRISGVAEPDPLALRIKTLETERSGEKTTDERKQQITKQIDTWKADYTVFLYKEVAANHNTCVQRRCTAKTDAPPVPVDGSGSGSGSAGSAAGSGSAVPAGSAATDSGSAAGSATGSAGSAGSATPADSGSATGSGSGSGSDATGSAAGSGAPAPGGDCAAAERQCREEAVATCFATRATSWLDDNSEIITAPKLLANKKAEAKAAPTDDTGGFSMPGALLGFGIIVLSQIVLRRRRQAA